MSSRLFCSFIQGVFATVFDPSQKKKRKKSKFDPQGDYLVSGKHITRRGGRMVNVLDSESNGLGSSPGHGHCVVIYNKTLTLGGNPVMDWHPIQGGVKILSVASCYRNRDRLRPDGPLGSSADF